MKVVGWIGTTFVALIGVSLIVVPWLLASDVFDLPVSVQGGFDASDAAAGTAAGATLLTALITAVLVVFTRRAVLVAQGSLEASFRPLLTNLSTWTRSGSRDLTIRADFSITLSDEAEVVARAEERGAVCSAPFRNVGVGPAIVKAVGLRAGEARGGIGFLSAAVVPANGLTRVTIHVPPDRSDWAELRSAIERCNGLVLAISYADSAGLRTWRTEAHLASADDATCYVRQLGIYDGNRLVTMTGPEDPRGLPSTIG